VAPLVLVPLLHRAAGPPAVPSRRARAGSPGPREVCRGPALRVARPDDRAWGVHPAHARALPAQWASAWDRASAAAPKRRTGPRLPALEALTGAGREVLCPRAEADVQVAARVVLPGAEGAVLEVDGPAAGARTAKSCRRRHRPLTRPRTRPCLRVK
jgi:hypothetical protein